MRVVAIVPAYNEGRRIVPVLDVLAAAPSVDGIIAVDDGSIDDTFQVASQHAAAQGKLRVVQQAKNQGKGAAMQRGADEAEDADILLFLDADLIGLTVAHVESLLAPVKSGEKVMALGVFRGGNFWTTLAQILAPNISGQRAIRREVFLSVPCLADARYGVELAITSFVMGEGLPMTDVVLKDVSHPTKERKLGLWRGAVARGRMYQQMLPFLLRRYHPTKRKR
ncbi:glycosyltransferase [Armatimonas rosea]|uniref:Glucosyl-3-phosphoglycerate synthase n=1 Tax=Armatimonas rosea TaxID=685828 RepID=A0A7W9SU61_ARMRO|nr:glycosyltransferase involved in cell wall biosynthesis [Armatimonas rosea]